MSRWSLHLKLKPPSISRWSLHYCAADVASAVPDARKKARENGRQLRVDIEYGNPLHIQAVSASFAIPGKAVQFIGAAAALDDDPHGSGGTPWRVRHFGRQQKQLALANRDIGDASVLDDSKHYISLDLKEQFFARVMMEILARIRTTDGHDDEGAVVKQQFITDRRFQQVTILVDPQPQVEGWRDLHTPIITGW
jgi:hypothetical protein